MGPFNTTQQLLDIKDWTDALKGGLPPVKLPKYVFGTAGCYSFMEEKLRPILEYEDLKAGVFQASMIMIMHAFISTPEYVRYKNFGTLLLSVHAGWNGMRQCVNTTLDSFIDSETFCFQDSRKTLSVYMCIQWLRRSL